MRRNGLSVMEWTVKQLSYLKCCSSIADLLVSQGTQERNELLRRASSFSFLRGRIGSCYLYIYVSWKMMEEKGKKLAFSSRIFCIAQKMALKGLY